jgi:hypothetical protein
MACWARKRVAIKGEHVPRKHLLSVALREVHTPFERQKYLRTDLREDTIRSRTDYPIATRQAGNFTSFGTGSRPFLKLIVILETHLSEIKSFLARLRKDFLPEPKPKENSQRLQELDDGFLVFTFQFFKFRGYVFCFARVAKNGVAKRYRSAIVHQSRTQAHSPQRRRADLVPAALKVLFRHII